MGQEYGRGREYGNMGQTTFSSALADHVERQLVLHTNSGNSSIVPSLDSGLERNQS